VVYLVSQAAERADQNIMGNVSPKVPYMRIVVYCRAAAVKAGFTGNKGFKVLDLSSKGIEKAKHLPS
jgi:deoxycytidine triphosphate deaminase